ncbi:MAG: helix-turn-helix domain-containing protein [Burkholderiales bacterium]|nr:helix-turn-helix domain-containing protein [Burkholderiales bacterium]
MLKFDDGGLRNVWLQNGYETRKTTYGKAVVFHDLEGLVQAVCSALVRKAGRLTGAEFRYLRASLGLSQASLGKLLGVTDQSVAGWEKRGRIPLLADKHLRLLWTEKHDGNEPIVRAMTRLNVIERLLNQKIVARESRRGWVAQAEDETV